ncbi:activating signal cointegrator 1 complex subunit [Rhizopus stolonifer]|uniref:Activating signal cointegrator 1 complex subunit n=1 Tax=Rhizopus stolonifer TaxID=4846 RepID=A0A367KQX3_RHIST|nr:activating signal cointegrator 1 complex subunit [Rhizopus stolonifer]
MKRRMTEADVLAMMSRSSEFDQIKSRDTEHQELKKLLENTCACDIKGGPEDTEGKVNILLQSYISNAYIDDFALISDCAYVAQNAGRIARALFEIALNRQWGPTASVLLDINKAVEKRMWTFQHPLRQMGLPKDVILRLENRTHQASVEEMREMQPQELADLVHHNPQMGMTLSKCVDQFPMLALDARMAPLTRNVLQIDLTLTPDFVWNDRAHGSVEPWYVWAEDAESEEIYYSEYLLVYKKQLGEPVKISFTIPLVEPMPSEIYLRALSDRWMGAETVLSIPLEDLVLPVLDPSYRELLPLRPLPFKALHNQEFETMFYSQQKTHFNPIQTQLFHTVYHTDQDIFLGAPEGADKRVVAEVGMCAAFRDHPGSKIVYLASKRGFVRERFNEWSTRWTGKRLIELSPKVSKNIVESADIILCTPRLWSQWEETIVDQVSLVIVDEIQLLEKDPMLEMVVSRLKHIGLEHKMRLLALSASLANAIDMAEWLGVNKTTGLYNFHPTAHPLEIHIDGFPGKHYNPRMAMMNKPTYTAIKTHSPVQPVIVFTSSRRQIKLTVLDLIAYCGMEDNPRQWLHMDDQELEMIYIHDELLRMTLAFGIGLYHTGLKESDARMVQELYMNRKIQILITTSDLAWNLNTNLLAHLVVVKGTEFYDSKEDRYVDFPVVDLLQMMGRANDSPDDMGVVRVFVQESKKDFYQTFLRESLPVESSLHTSLDLKEEIMSGRVKTKQDAMDYISWTFMYRRLGQNPSYYGLEGNPDKYLSSLVNQNTEQLEQEKCIEIEDHFKLKPLKDSA